MTENRIEQGVSLHAENIVKTFAGRAVLDGVSLDLRPGEGVALLGPSGSGKSTLLNILGTLDTPDEGRLTAASAIDRWDLLSFGERDRQRFRAERVGFVFQEHHLLPQLTALENVLLPTLAIRHRSGEDRATSLLGSLGLKDRARQYPATLSGGERQRVAVARALVNDPPILLCDEPTGNLDQESGDALIALLLELSRQGKAVLVVTHNEEQATRFGRMLRLRDGRLS